MISRIRVTLVALAVALMTLILLPIQYISVKLGWPLSRKIPVWWHKVTASLIGLKINIDGQFSKDRPLLIVSNHTSWADIVVLGSLTELSFIAKHEVDDIFGANLLARMQRTIFVAREAKRESGKQAQQITERMLAGDAMVLFAEGTTGDGHRLLDFKSSLFGATQFALKAGAVENAFIQPVCICYKKLHGIPLGRKGRTIAAWPGDIELGPHLRTFLQHSAWDIDVHIGEPIEVDHSMRRKHLSAYTQEQIRNMFVCSNYQQKA